MNKLFSVSTLLSNAWADYKTKLKPLALLMAGLYVAMGIIMVISTGGSLATSVGAGDLGAGIVPFIIGMIVLAVVGILAEIALIYLAAGRERSIRAALRRAPKQFWAFLGLIILLGLTILGGFILLIIPGLIFLVWFSFSYFVFLLEDKKIVESMKTSKAYVKGRFWPVVVRFLTLWLIMLPFWIVAGLAGDDNTFGFIVNAAVGIFVAPFAIVYMYHLYKNLKETKATTPEKQVVSEPAA